MIDTPSFTGAIQVTIVDLYNENIAYTENRASLLPVPGRSDLFRVDLCTNSVGLATACLASISYGRLKIEDTAGSGKAILDLTMVSGRLDGGAMLG